MTTYGYSLAEWNKAKKEMRKILIERAKVRGMIPYSELVAAVQTICLEPESYALGAILGEISRSEDAAGRGMLSVIVVHKSDKQPGAGFFDLAHELGYDTSDRLKFWSDESNKVYAYWGS